jgi:hypothetical protein
VKFTVELEVNEGVLVSLAQNTVDGFFGQSTYNANGKGADVVRAMTRKALDSAMAEGGQVEQMVNAIVADALAGDVVETLVNEQIDKLVNRKVLAMVKAWQEAGR